MPREDVTIDHYAALEVSTTATSDEIKKQFRKLALKYHPDRNPGRETEFNAKFQQIQAAHELLTDPGRRKLYDRSRLHYNSNNKPRPDRYDVSTPSSESPASSRKYPSATHRSAYATSARPSEAHFSAKSQWDYASRTYTPGGASAWKAAQERWQQRSSREMPRTPKKTRENPYVSVDPEPPSAGESAYRFYKDDGAGLSGGKTPIRHGFFGDRNPREKEWMDPNSEHKPGGNYNRRSGGIWETKSSSEEDAPRQSTFYAFTPRTHLRTNLRDTSPDRTGSHGNSHQNGGYSAKPKTASPSDPSVSPQRSGVFTRPQTTRDSKEHGDQTTSNQDRRKSNSSVGLEGTERRKFSYLFNEDGLRKPHRTTKQTAGSDNDEEDSFSKPRNTPLRQSYPSSRRNTLDRETPASKGLGESRNNYGPKNPDRQRFNGHSYGKSEDSYTPLNSFKSFETNASSPISFPGSPSKEEPRPKSFSPADWNTVFSGNENIFAPPPRKGPQSPRKGPTIPNIQTNFGTGEGLNFSRPRPTSTSEESSNVSKDTGVGESSPQGDSPTSHEDVVGDRDPNTFPKNAFVFEEWQKAFSETNPFDINPSHQNTSGSTARSASKHRKTATTKRSAGSFTTQKAPTTDNCHNHASSSASITPTERNSHPPQSEEPSVQKDADLDANTSIPSPVAMDIDTPQKSPITIPTAPVTPIRQNPSILKTPPVDRSPVVSEADPVSPIRTDGVPISPLRSDEVPQREYDATESSSQNIPKDAPPLRSTVGEIPKEPVFPNLGGLRNVEPLSYASANGLNSHWHNMRDNLPFESKAASFVRLSPAPELSKKALNLPKAPEAPTTPNDISLTSYDKYCAQMTVYQAHWNEYNGKIVNHLRARLDADILQCAQNKGFATGTSTDPETGIELDLKQTMKAIFEIDEDRRIRGEWETAIVAHRKVLDQWKSFLEGLGATRFP
ncbi:hypothetical protein TWF970_009905 [Orbilia oligospora]|uniref:J domain-containing protein n=2 Tax=Orbilia oligospora TaxID=2813651 RepID=A0A7C8V027_ORBOL|nr:hypothetical protein TWF970_009905 [Orbilia oligospora]